METKITTGAAHGLSSGDVVTVPIGGRWAEAWRLLKRPRISYVTVATNTEMTIAQRRMTWQEWRAAWVRWFRW